MPKLHDTASGSISLMDNGREFELLFNNFRLHLSARSLSHLEQHLEELDYSSAMFKPEDRCFEVNFTSCRFSLLFNYFEIVELIELVGEGLAWHSVDSLLHGLGVAPSFNSQEPFA